MLVGQNNQRKRNNITHYCYLITNKLNGKVYVGVTYKTIDVRFEEHIKVSNFLSETNKKAIHKAIKKYGKENFKIELLEQFTSKEAAYEAEIKYIKSLNSRNKKVGYNQSIGGDCGPIKIKFDSETVINVLNDYCTGILLDVISKKYNIPYHSVFDITRLRISKTHLIPEKLLYELNEFKQKSKKKKRITKIDIESIINDFIKEFTMQEIANKYNLSLNNVWNIVHRKTWKNIAINSILESKLKEKLNEK